MSCGACSREVSDNSTAQRVTGEAAPRQPTRSQTEQHPDRNKTKIVPLSGDFRASGREFEVAREWEKIQKSLLNPIFEIQRNEG